MVDVARRAVHQASEVERLRVQLDPVRGDAGGVEKILDEARESIELASEYHDNACACGGGTSGSSSCAAAEAAWSGWRICERPAGREDASRS